jgi:ABC-2 type transport system ATP-binding protein
MIRTESLTKFYGERCAVRDLSLSIADQEIVGFLGLNGAGKTTTLRMLAGLLAPSSGTIELDGQRLEAATAGGVRWRIGFLPERPPLYEEMTVEAFLAFAARLRGYDEAGVGARLAEVLALTRLEDYRGEPISSLSHGYRQRVGIAQAVVHEPALVILDEPTSGLDPVQIVEMRALIRDLKARHTVLISSHNLPEISQTCDRLLVIRGGELIAQGTEAELAQRLGGGSRVLLEIAGDASRLGEVLGALEARGVLRAARTTALAGGITEVRAELVGAPEIAARALVEAGLGLRRLQPQTNELESLFFELTRTKEAA